MSKKFNEMTVAEKFDFCKETGMPIDGFPELVRYERTIGYSGTLQAIDKIDFSGLIPDKKIAGMASNWLKRDIELYLDTDKNEALKGIIINSLKDFPSLDLEFDTRIGSEKYRVVVTKVKDVTRLSLAERIAREEKRLAELRAKADKKD